MIAAMGPAAQQQQYPMPDDLEERLCPGCKLSVVSEEGGLVVAFGYVLIASVQTSGLRIFQAMLLPC